MSETRLKTLELKSAISQLYCVEGKSLNYISKLFGLNRRSMTEIVKKEWKFEQSNVRVATPRIKKLINTHKEVIMNYLLDSENRTLTPLFESVGITRGLFRTLCAVDVEMKDASDAFTRKPSQASLFRERLAAKVLKDTFEAESLEGEVWAVPKGYEDRYEVSNLGRVKSLHHHPKIMKQYPNPRTGRLQVVLMNDKGETKMLRVSRLVGFCFVEGFDSEGRNTIGHKNGVITDDRADNLEWQTQAEQNWHKHYILQRTVAKTYGRNGRFDKVVIDDQYEFKTLKAAAKFLNVSETQIQRYIRNECICPRKIELKY